MKTVLLTILVVFSSLAIGTAISEYAISPLVFPKPAGLSPEDLPTRIQLIGSERLEAANAWVNFYRDTFTGTEFIYSGVGMIPLGKPESAK